jgi:hypothetical protein
MSKITLANWVTRGKVRARQETGPLRRWIVWADAAESDRLRHHAHRSTTRSATTLAGCCLRITAPEAPLHVVKEEAAI